MCSFVFFLFFYYDNYHKKGEKGILIQDQWAVPLAESDLHSGHGRPAAAAKALCSFVLVCQINGRIPPVWRRPKNPVFVVLGDQVHPRQREGSGRFIAPLEARAAEDGGGGLPEQSWLRAEGLKWRRGRFWSW